MKICRACMCSNNTLVEIDNSFVYNYNLITNLNISLCDGMSQYCCQTCIETLNFFVTFREKCIITESALRSTTHQQIKLELENDLNVALEDKKEIKVKDEITDDNYDEASFFDSCFNICYEVSDNVNIKSESKVTEYVKKTRKTKRRPQKEKIKSTKTKIINERKIIKNVKDNSLYCGLCPKKFNERHLLNNHIDGHKHQKQCGVCKETYFKNWPMMISHRLAHVPNNQYSCHMCSKKCQTTVSLEYHYMCTHFEGENIGVTCKYCFRNYKTPRHLKGHVWAIHSGNIYICDHCSKTFTNKSALRSHLKSHSDQDQILWLCDLCEYSCKVRTNLEQHIIRKHTAVKFKCDKCGKLFRSTADRNKHKCCSTSSICPVCGKQFDQNQKLRRHLKCHQSEAVHRCERCPAAYRSPAALKVHRNKHDGNRTHHCDFCAAKFYYASVLIKHRRTHTGEKPYVCKICNKGFTGGHNLKVHMKVHGEMLVVKRNQETDDVILNK